MGKLRINMREIKFRVWDNQNNDWLIKQRIEDHPVELLYSDHKFYISHSLDNLDDYTIQQYTGLKDKNGNDIYEGDILCYLFDGASYPKEAKDEILICKWQQKNAWYVFNETLEEDSNEYYWLEIKDNYQVIGNIFENSELLENEKN